MPDRPPYVPATSCTGDWVVGSRPASSAGSSPAGLRAAASFVRPTAHAESGGCPSLWLAPLGSAHATGTILSIHCTSTRCAGWGVAGATPRRPQYAVGSFSEPRHTVCGWARLELKVGVGLLYNEDFIICVCNSIFLATLYTRRYAASVTI